MPNVIYLGQMSGTFALCECQAESVKLQDGEAQFPGPLLTCLAILEAAQLSKENSSSSILTSGEPLRRGPRRRAPASDLLALLLSLSRVAAAAALPSLAVPLRLVHFRLTPAAYAPRELDRSCYPNEIGSVLMLVVGSRIIALALVPSGKIVIMSFYRAFKRTKAKVISSIKAAHAS